MVQPAGFALERLDRLDPGTAREVLALAARVHDADGVAAMSEQWRLAVAGERAADAHLLARGPDGALLGYAGMLDGSAELLVDPPARRRGIGSALAGEVLAAAPEAAIWAHGNLPGAQGLGKILGLDITRELLQLRRLLQHGEPNLAAAVALSPGPLPGQASRGVSLRTWRDPGDDAEILRVNNAAFSWHPEQGGWSLADITSRHEQDWFDPDGLFIAEDTDTGAVLGFHWTKIHPGTAWASALGEVYIVGVDPAAQGRGIGRLVTLAGLRYLAAARPSGTALEAVELYVEGDNTAALATYRGLGFSPFAVDISYARARA